MCPVCTLLHVKCDKDAGQGLELDVFQRKLTNCRLRGWDLRVRSEVPCGLRFYLSEVLIGSGRLRCLCALDVPCELGI